MTTKMLGRVMKKKETNEMIEGVECPFY